VSFVGNWNLLCGVLAILLYFFVRQSRHSSIVDGDRWWSQWTVYRERPLPFRYNNVRSPVRTESYVTATNTVFCEVGGACVGVCCSVGSVLKCADWWVALLTCCQSSTMSAVFYILRWFADVTVCTAIQATVWLCERNNWVPVTLYVHGRPSCWLTFAAVRPVWCVGVVESWKTAEI
jgi:hypothetical protein